MAALCCGFGFAWSSPSMPKLVNDKENYDITEEEAVWFTVIPPISMSLATLMTSRLNDIFGRKKVIIFLGVLHVINWTLVITARSVNVFYVARVLSGVADACVFSSIPMYIGEVSIPEVRGRWGNMLAFNIFLGQFLINTIGSFLTVVQMGYVAVSVPILFLIIFPFMPESPYYYAMKDRDDEARTALIWLRRKRDIEEDFQQLKNDVNRQISESGTWKDLFTIKSNRKALYAGLFLRAAQQFSGISVFAVYTHYMFTKAGGSISPTTSVIIFTGSLMVLNFVAGLVVDKLGRRKAFMYSLFCCGVILMGMSVYFYLDQYHPEVDMSLIQSAPLVGMMLFVVASSFGMGVVPTLMLGELFSTSIKAKALCFLIIVFGVQLSIVTRVFYILDVNFGLYCPFLIFGLNCLISSILTLYIVPETKGKTLEEIQQSLKQKKKAVT